MRVVPLILGVAMAGTPIFAAAPAGKVSDDDRKQVVAIVATLHSVESELIRQSAVKAPEYKASVNAVRELVRATAQKMHLASRGCQPGFCLKDDMCVPCDPKRKKLFATPELFPVLATLHALKNELLRQLELGSSDLKDSEQHMLVLAVKSQWATRTTCQQGFCMGNDGLCHPC